MVGRIDGVINEGGSVETTKNWSLNSHNISSQEP